MKNQEIITTNLSDFGMRELKLLEYLIRAWREQGLPDDFYQDEVVPLFNKNSGCVFLTNSEYQVAMLNGDKLEMWYHCPNCGHEGFRKYCNLNDKGCNACCPQTINSLIENVEVVQ